MPARPPITDKPAASVILPTYNRMDTLPLCLEHLERQNFRDFEVIVVDDGSTDGTPELLARHAAAGRLRLRSHRQGNSGPATARNYAIRLAQAPLCIVLGDDILAGQDFIAAHVRFHQEHAALQEAAVGLTRWSETEQTVTPFMRWLEQGFQFDYRPLLGGQCPNWTHFYTSNVSVKTELLRRQPFDERFRRALLEDSELGYRLHRKENLQLSFLPEALGMHVHPIDFARACRRAREMGQVSIFFDALWPEAHGAKSERRLWLRERMGQNRWLVGAVTWAAGQVTRRWCPNPLLGPALSLQRAAGRSAKGSDF